MIRTFELKKGTLAFEEDKIVITDNEKIRWRLMLFFVTLTLILALPAVSTYLISDDQYQTWFGIFIGLAFVFALVGSSFRSVQNEIDLKEVKSLKMKQGLLDEYLEIKLTNRKIRRVSAIIDKEGLRAFIDTNSISKPIFESNQFELKKGKIVFEEDRIVIVDNARRQRNLRFFSSSMWIFFGTMSVLRYLKTGDQFLLWTGLIIGVGHLVIIVLNLFKSVQSEILLNEVKSMKIKKRAGNEFLDVKLKNNRTRRVTEIFNPDRLNEQIKTMSL